MKDNFDLWCPLQPKIPAQDTIASLRCASGLPRQTQPFPMGMRKGKVFVGSLAMSQRTAREDTGELMVGFGRKETRNPGLLNLPVSGRADVTSGARWLIPCRREWLRFKPALTLLRPTAGSGSANTVPQLHRRRDDLPLGASFRLHKRTGCNCHSINPCVAPDSNACDEPLVGPPFEDLH
jgi:hypothetical protein